ncbi:MAG: hypothetical protein HXX81_03190 [Campylobacterales bacterium]|nr:hypothetical protein [Campylobacterales bacterium]
MQKLALIVFSFIFLISWKVVYVVDCYSFILACVIASVVAISIVEENLRRRECIANCYFNERSGFYKIIRSPYFIAFKSFIVSLVLSFSLLSYITICSKSELIFFIFRYSFYLFFV